AGEFLDVVDKLFRDVHGIDLARSSDRRREQSSKEASSSADICDRHSRSKPESCDDFLAMIEDVPAIGLKPLYGVGQIGRLIVPVDPRVYALFLTPQGWSEKQDQSKRGQS